MNYLYKKIETVVDFFTGTNGCSVNNGGCTHLCLARPDGITCECPEHPEPIQCFRGK